MFENIEQLEKQIKEFQDNITKSSNLALKINEFIDEMGNINKNFNTNGLELIKQLEISRDALAKQYEEVNKSFNDFFTVLPNSIDKVINGFNEELSKKISDLFYNLENKYKKITEESIDRVQTFSDAKIKLIEEFSKKISNSFNDLENKYNKITEESIDRVQTFSDAKIKLIEEFSKNLIDAKEQLDKNYLEFITMIKNNNFESISKKIDKIEKGNKVSSIVIMAGLSVSIILSIIAIIL